MSDSAYNKRYYAEHGEEIRARRKAHYQSNIEEERVAAVQRTRKYREIHRERLNKEQLQKVDELQAVVNLAKSRPCADCGKQWPPVAMDFDHVRGDKIDNIATMVGQRRPLQRIIDEIAKCEVVCACCHRLRTFERMK